MITAIAIAIVALVAAVLVYRLSSDYFVRMITFLTALVAASVAISLLVLILLDVNY